MTITSSASPATTLRSWLTRISEIAISVVSFFSSSRICACTDTSSAVVGSSASCTRGSRAFAIAITTRCRMPPLNSCG